MNPVGTMIVLGLIVMLVVYGLPVRRSRPLVPRPQASGTIVGRLVLTENGVALGRILKMAQPGPGLQAASIAPRTDADVDESAPEPEPVIVSLPRRPLVYLACPYSHDEDSVCVARAKIVCQVAGALMRKGLIVYSPISHTHAIAGVAHLPLAFNYWEMSARCFLACSYKLIVLQLPGWEESVGVTAEIAIATALGLPIEYMPAP